MSYLTSDECWIVVCITLAILIWLLKFIVKPYNMASKVNERGGLYPHTETPLTLSKPPSKIHLSLVIPAYNEEERLPPMLSATFNFLKSTPLCSKSNQVEVIVVSDGSTDETCSVVKRASAPDTLPPNTHLRLITLSQNRGKGAAIKLGMLAAKGDYVLMVDADGATDVNDAEKLMKVMQSLPQPHPLAGRAVLGSRAHLTDSSAAERTLVRTILMRLFHFFVENLCSKTIHDTQCGFKLFDQTASRILFKNLHLDRWAFDIEVVSVAEAVGTAIAEVGVTWEEIDGSKLDTSKVALAYNSVLMLRDMCCVWLCYRCELWRLPLPRVKRA